jgi:hypothetical protein
MNSVENIQMMVIREPVSSLNWIWFGCEVLLWGLLLWGILDVVLRFVVLKKNASRISRSTQQARLFNTLIMSSSLVVGLVSSWVHLHATSARCLNMAINHAEINVLLITFLSRIWSDIQPGILSCLLFVILRIRHALLQETEPKE